MHLTVYSFWKTTLLLLCPSFNFFLSAICSCWKQGAWCNESNANQWDKVTRPPSQIWLRNVVVTPSLSLILTKSSFHPKVIWEKVSCNLEKLCLYHMWHLFCSAFSHMLFSVYKGSKLFKSRDVQLLFKNVHYKRQICLLRSLDQHRWPKTHAVSTVTWNLSRDVTLFCRHCL